MNFENEANRKNIKIEMPKDVSFIIQVLKENGYEGYAVGGCVRDSLLGRVPNDWDITTSALPEQVKALFPRTIDTGIEHGTVTIMRNHIGYEVTTYRIDGKYEDNRHPTEVTFTPSLEEDLKRRDFTINAMAYNDEDGLVDLFGGCEDLQNKIIRAVGDAHLRFSEDALRMMRAVRFAAQLGYEIEEETKRAIRELAVNLKSISAERIQVELVKLVTSNHPEHMQLLYETTITQQIFPEFDRIMNTQQNHPHHCYSVGMHTIHAMLEVKNDKVLRLAMLFHDIGKPDTKTTDEDGIDHFHGHPAVSEKIAKNVLRRLKFDNYTIERVCKLSRLHDQEILPEPKYVRRALNKMGEEIFVLLFDVKRADILAQSMYKREEKLERLENLKLQFDQIKASEQCFCLRDLAVSGKDLIEIGVKPGPDLGKRLNELLELVIDEPELNTKEKLISIAKERIFS